MQVRKFVVVMAVLVGFAGAPMARAFAEEGRDPAAADSSTPHKKKKKKSVKKKSKAKKKAKKTTHARSHKKSSSSGGSPSAGTHYPTQPGGSGFSDIPAEKKDDLPPPSTPAAN